MKKYKFKLEALLKMRKLEEEQCKMRIGRLQTKKNELLAEVEKQNMGIDEAYRSQEATIQGGASGLDLRFYPYYFQGKKAAKAKLNEQIEQLDDLLTEAYGMLKEFRAKAKVLEEMKEKDQKAHKKLANKQMHQKIEEQVMNWSQFNARTRK